MPRGWLLLREEPPPLEDGPEVRPREGGGGVEALTVEVGSAPSEATTLGAFGGFAAGGCGVVPGLLKSGICSGFTNMEPPSAFTGGLGEGGNAGGLFVGAGGVSAGADGVP